MNERSKNESISVADALVHARQILKSHPEKAAEQARAIIEVEPGIAEGYLLLATALRLMGDTAQGDELERQAIDCALRDPVITRAAKQIQDGEYQAADQLLNFYLADTPNDPVAVHLRARIQLALGHKDESERLLRRSSALAPGYETPRVELAQLQATTQQDDRPEDEPWFTSRPPGDEDESTGGNH